MVGTVRCLTALVLCLADLCPASAQTISRPSGCPEVAQLASSQPSFAAVAQTSLDSATAKGLSAKDACALLRKLELELSDVGSTADYCQMTDPASGLKVSSYRAVVDTTQDVLQDIRKKERGFKCAEQEEP